MGAAICTLEPREREARASAECLNETCHCISLDRQALEAALASASGDPDFVAAHITARPHLFSSTAVFLARRDAAAMMDVVAAVEAAAQAPGYRAAVLARAPESAQPFFGQRGAFMGYDFHVTDDGPRLIEVNTNAGGAFLNAFAARAQAACCPAVARAVGEVDSAAFEDAVIAQFESEWRAQFGDAPLRRIAIVDDAPEGQYLYPEFVLAQRLLQQRGFDAIVADAQSLRYVDGKLLAGEAQVDLVYNRLVDFDLSDPAHAALRQAYLDGAVAVTPNPRNHAMLADKRNLALLSDAEVLRGWGVSAPHVQTLVRALRAVTVEESAASALWENRRNLVFKPAAGYGGKAVYRGDKITRGVWADITRGGYVAQQYAPPSMRTVIVDGAPQQLKLDVRLYTYAGQMLLAAARLYRGQTTNFRTPGGGFAPVIMV
jgi:glutathione synthase/RimK-type ligase-like ATP-grasp enzyme